MKQSRSSPVTFWSMAASITASGKVTRNLSQTKLWMETREREDRFVNQIISSVESAMEKTLPIFLAGCMAGLSQVPVAAAPVTQQEPDAELDWDFLGE